MPKNILNLLVSSGNFSTAMMELSLAVLGAVEAFDAVESVGAGEAS